MSLKTILLLLIGIINSSAQNVPLGNWEAHYSYLSAQHVLQAGNRIFCSSYNGLLSINPENRQIKTFSKADGLSEAGISSMAYNAADNILILAYKSGNIDLIALNGESEPEQITAWPVLINSADLPVSKQISQIIFHKSLAYLATNFGIVVLDAKLQNVEETYRYIGSNGTEMDVKDIAFASDSIYALTSEGILVSSMQPSVNRQYFANWKTVSSPGTVIALSSQTDELYAGFSGKGIFKRSDESWFSIYSSSSQYYSFSNTAESIVATLDKNVVVIPKTDQPKLFASTLFNSPRASFFIETKTIWTADSKNGLLSNIDGDFKSFSPAEADTTINLRTDSTVIDQNGLAWTHLPSYLGGGISVKNITTNQQRILTTAAGNGGLPSSLINSLAIDQDGYIWFGSDKGAGYFLPDDILSGTITDAILPVYGQRKLFANEKCTAISVEPGNRKWIGTRNGLYLFNNDGTELIEQFTASESPLPSDHIIALKFHPEMGMLFIDTPNGMVSYRSNSTAPAEDLSLVTIFPNPVRPGFGGQVGIKGLMDKSVVKITQLSGRLVYETKSEGGTASWDLNDYTGKRARGGIYMVLVISGNGEEKLAGKLAIID
ncbi:two-component regulator propeller domain-containing protein [Dyadobacter sp. NIV53]|uniref:PorZ beta-propeller-like domain-containing protein n=1 Tax=Dyadobacter sp. NIV53 TaxID=2861765 RepID=UPI001C876569|nr:two-component regulator propeller domain-containing protein [Dyadobacter sp. NIV53]